MYEVNHHKKLIEDHIIDQNIEKAGAEGYVFGPYMKTMLTIKAFKGYRVLNNMFKQIAVEYSN